MANGAHQPVNCRIGSLLVMILATSMDDSARWRSSAASNSVCMIVPMRLCIVTGLSAGSPALAVDRPTTCPHRQSAAGQGERTEASPMVAAGVFRQLRRAPISPHITSRILSLRPRSSTSSRNAENGFVRHVHLGVERLKLRRAAEHVQTNDRFAGRDRLFASRQRGSRADAEATRPPRPSEPMRRNSRREKPGRPSNRDSMIASL